MVSSIHRHSTIRASQYISPASPTEQLISGRPPLFPFHPLATHWNRPPSAVQPSIAICPSKSQPQPHPFLRLACLFRLATHCGHRLRCDLTSLAFQPFLPPYRYHSLQTPTTVDHPSRSSRYPIPSAPQNHASRCPGNPKKLAPRLKPHHLHTPSTLLNFHDPRCNFAVRAAASPSQTTMEKRRHVRSKPRS